MQIHPRKSFHDKNAWVNIILILILIIILNDVIFRLGFFLVMDFSAFCVFIAFAFQFVPLPLHNVEI